jgi:hypothetical protein
MTTRLCSRVNVNPEKILGVARLGFVGHKLKIHKTHAMSLVNHPTVTKRWTWKKPKSAVRMDTDQYHVAHPVLTFSFSAAAAQAPAQ